MKKYIPPALFLATSVFVSSTQAQVVFLDTVGDTFTDAGSGILDITGVQVSHTDTDLTFIISLDGNPVATNWGKYMIGFDTIVGTGDTASNGWERPISMSSGMNHWIGTWVDENTGGGQVWNFDTSSSLPIWSLNSQMGGSNPANLLVLAEASSVTIQVSLASLGLTAESSFRFDIYTSGGGAGDSAVDAAGNPSQSIADWGNFYDSGTDVLTYAIPEPSTYAAIFGGLALLGAFAYRRRSRAKN
jgi:hypothetical protein